MSEIKISENLSQKLGEDTIGKIRFLTDFEASIKEKLSADKCPDEVRNIISNKMRNITEIVSKIYKINKSHRSNEEKKEKIEAIFEGIDTKELITALDTEIKGTREFLLLKAKGMGKEIEQDAKDAVDSIEKMIRTNQDLVSEEKARLKKEESELKRRRYNPELVQEEIEENNDLDSFNEKEESKPKRRRYNPELTQQETEEQNVNLPVKAEPLGFWKTFRKFINEGKENADKKMGIFSALKAAWNTSISNNIDYDENPLEKAEQESKREKIYKLQLQIDQKLKKCDEDYKKLSEQLKELRKEIESLSIEGLKDTRNAFDDAVEPVSEEEITEERISGIAERIAKFSRDNRFVEWIRNLREDLVENATKIIDTGKAKAVELREKVADKIDDVEIDILESRISRSKEKNIKAWDNVKEAEEKSNTAKEARDESKADFIQVKQVAQRQSNSTYLDSKVAKKIIKGVSAMEYIIANTRFKLKNGNFAKTVEKYEQSSEKIKQYEKKKEEAVSRREERNSGMDR